jgi:ketosteroid isomerase-like protein
MEPLDAARSALDRYFKAMENRDWDMLRSCFIHDDTLIYVGTDETEIWQGWQEAEPFLRSQIENFERVMVERSPVQERLTSSGDTMLFVERARMKILSKGREHEVQVRLSGALEKRDDRWVISQFHRSVTPTRPVVAYTDQHLVRFQ